jgi:hypothetical protein
VAFKAYFDGGNKADSRHHKVVTLAGVSADSLHWKNFDVQWCAALERHHANWLHTTDAVALRGVFSRDNGWDETKVEALISDCVAVLERCCATIGKRKEITYPGLRPAAVTVVLEDYKRALNKIPDLGTVEHLCATQCAQAVFVYGIYIAKARRFQFYFDRGEPYYGHVKDRVDNRKSRRLGRAWNLVTYLGESNMRETPGLQAADLFAWAVNHHYQKASARFDWQKRLLKINHEHDHYDYRRMLKPIRENIETVKTFKLPRRRPTP